MRYRRGAFAALALLLAGAAPAAGFGVGELMQGLAQPRSGSATFSEKKYLAILDQPLESSGELLFLAPARLEKHTLKPRAETLVLDGDTLTLERGRRRQVLRLHDVPELAALVESIRATLAGDRLALERIFRLSLDGTAQRWTLALTPRDPAIGAVVARIDISGVHNAVTRVAIFQADGDHSEMRIVPAAAPVTGTP